MAKGKVKTKMRLDKYLSKCTDLSRSEATRALKNGFVKLNGSAVRDGKTNMDYLVDEVLFDGEPLLYRENIYLMLNKPQGYICSTEDEKCATILELISSAFASRKPYACGRLDIDTTGLVLMTDDGNWSYGITAPKKKCEKTYLIDSASELSDDDMSKIEEGLFLDDDEKITAPAKIEKLGELKYRLKITEGRFHQVKRMFEAVGNMVKKLHREQIGPIVLDSSLDLGQWRELTTEEVDSLRK